MFHYSLPGQCAGPAAHESQRRVDIGTIIAGDIGRQHCRLSVDLVRLAH